MKSLHDQISDECVHFNGHQNGKCDEGVSYDSVEDASKKGFARFPCWKEGESVPCEKRKFPTEAEVQEWLAEHDRRWEMLEKAFAAVRADGDKRGYGKGHGGQGAVKCPCCADGELSYSVSGYNGHVHGRCSTAGCVRWMQ